MSPARRTLYYLVLPALAIVIAGAFWRRGERPFPCKEINRAASVYPDYSGAAIPPNVAPLNLRIREAGSRFCLRLAAGKAEPLYVFSKDGNVQIPEDEWRKLLVANAGRELRMDLYARVVSGWLHFTTVRTRIARDRIDP